MTAPPRQTMLATAPVSKLIWTFAIPAILSQVVNSMHNIVDQTFLGWGIGDLAIAATNIAFPLSTLTTALAALIGMGGAAGFSLDLGKKQARSARKNWGNAIVLSVGLGCLLAVLAVAFLEPMLYLFGATGAMMIYAVPYARIISMGLPFAIFSMAMAHFIRADGSPKFSSGVLLSGAIFNMIFDPIFLLFHGHPGGCSGHGAGTGTLQLSGPLLSGAPAPHGDPGAGGFPSICWYDQRDRRAGGRHLFQPCDYDRSPGHPDEHAAYLRGPVGLWQ